MRYLPREDGQGLLEYALILVFIAITVIVIVGILGGQIGDQFQEVANALSY